MLFLEKYEGRMRISREITSFYSAGARGLGKYDNFDKLKKSKNLPADHNKRGKKTRKNDEFHENPMF